MSKAASVGGLFHDEPFPLSGSSSPKATVPVSASTMGAVAAPFRSRFILSGPIPFGALVPFAHATFERHTHWFRMITAQELRSRAEDADAKAVAAHDEVVRHAYQEIARHWRELAEEAEKYRHSEK